MSGWLPLIKNEHHYKPMYHKFFTALILLLSVVMIGCGGRAQVSGTVTFEDGTLLTKGNVRALVDEVEVRGVIEEDGTFTLFEIKPGDGIPSGRQYKIWIVNALETIPPPQAEGRSGPGLPPPAPPTIRELVHADYTRVNTTPLTLDVPKGSPKISHDITVRRP